MRIQKVEIYNRSLVKLETSIWEANIQKHLIAVFLDQKKAYETTWKFGIMNDQYSLGLRGRLSNFIKSFLLNRKFWVKVELTFSNLHKKEEGVPQRSILSVTLFNIKFTALVSVLLLELMISSMLTTSVSLPDQNICELQSINCNNASGKLLIGQTQMVSKSPKAKCNMCPFDNWKKMYNELPPSSNLKIWKYLSLTNISSLELYSTGS